jgi:hypothetical protein
MNRKLQMLMILFAAVAICAAASHAAIGWLGIKATWGGQQCYGPRNAPPQTILYGSSPAYSGLDWNQIAEATGGAIESWATAGSSPTEWEMNRQPSDVTRTFIVVTPSDLNEYYLCDFRADIVPLSQTIQDLQKSNLDWQQCKRMLSQYPRLFVRKLFPTIGRSDGVMVGIRAKLQKLTGVSSSLDTGDAPKFGATDKSEVKERISDWPEARIQRRLVLLRNACLGKHAFNGPKKLALVRMVQRAEMQGQAVVVVLPLPPIYHEAFLSPAVMSEFEDVLKDVQRLCPKMQMIRLDQVPDLNNNDYYSDYVHMNMYGQQIATEVLLSRLKVVGIAR